MRIELLERWEMDVEGDPDREPVFYGDWVVRDKRKMSKPVTASWYALRSVRDLYHDDIETVQEMFAGIGAQALMNQELFDPLVHIAQEWVEEGTDHLSSVLTGVEVRQADAYAPESVQPGMDLYCLDNDFKARTLRPGDRDRDLLERVLEQQPRAVVLADVAGLRLGLHRHLNEDVLGEGTCNTYLDYLRTLSDWMESEFGYAPIHVYHTGQFAKFALAPVDDLVVPTQYSLVPDSPVGLKILSG